MTTRNLAAVRARLEQAVARLPRETGTSPQAQFDALEEVSIQILDSEFTDFTQGALEEYLQTYLYLRQLELGLIKSDPRE